VALANVDNALFNISNAWAERINNPESYLYTSGYMGGGGGGGGWGGIGSFYFDLYSTANQICNSNLPNGKYDVDFSKTRYHNGSYEFTYTYDYGSSKILNELGAHTYENSLIASNNKIGNYSIGESTVVANDPNYPCVTIFYIKGLQWGCYLPGVGILVSDKPATSWVQHEYGHFLQYMFKGANYYFNYVMPISGTDAILCQMGLSTDKRHNNLFCEKEANSYANSFFGANSKVGGEGYPLLPQNNNNQPNFWYEFKNTFKNGMQDLQNWNGMPW